MQIAEIQRNFFNKGEVRDIKTRVKHLYNLKQSITKYEPEIFKALNKNLGKCDFEGFATEVGLVLKSIDSMIKNIGKYNKPKRVSTPLMFFGGTSYIVREPFGTVLILGPWNFPFQLTMLPLVGAIAAGNCAVLKPSELAPDVSSIITRIVNETFRKEYVTSIEGGIDTSTQLLSQRFDYIFYTGGTTVGKVVMEAAAKNLTPVTLELGGKSPCIVESDANLATAARRIAWGKFLNSGQTCVAPDYIIVHKKIKNQFIEKVISTINEFYGKEPINSGHYSKIVNERHFDRLLSLMKDGKILHGGKSSREKLRIEPTIISEVNKDSKIMQEEIFGPLMPILEFDDLEEAISLIGSKPKPLALYIFTNSKEKVQKVLNETSSGGVCVNDTINHIINSNLPFGGVGDSGMGSYHGRASFDTFSHKRSVFKNQVLFDVKLKFPPYNASTKFMKKVFKCTLN